MTELELCCAAAVAAVVARMSPAIPVWVAVVGLVVAMVVRHPSVVALALVLLVGWRSHSDLDGLRPPATQRVRVRVTVVSDPVASFGRWQVDVIDGRRHERATVPRSEPAPVVGEHLDVVAVRSRATDSGVDRARHISAVLDVTEVRATSPPNAVMAGVNGLRSLLVDGAASLGVDRPLFAGLVLGDDSQQSDELRHDFRASGLAHLLAVSGQNVAFVLVAASPVLGRLPLRSRWSVTVGVLVLFTLVTRWEPSVLRAVVMALVAASASLTGRYASGRRLLASAVLLLLVVDPLLIWSTGFQLSGAAPLATVLAAQVGTAPLLAAMGSRLSVASVPANLLAVPVAGWVMVWGLPGGLFAGAVGSPVAGWIHAPTAWMLRWIDSVATLAASPRWPSLGIRELLVVAASVVVVRLAAGTRLRQPVAGLAAVVVVAVVLWPAGAARSDPVSGLVVLRSDTGATVVVAGGQVRAGRLLDELTRLRVDHVDLLILTSTSRSTTALAATVRHATDVVRVLADPALVRGAAAIEAGEVRVGDLDLRVRREGDRWVVDVPDGGVRGPV